MGVRNPGGGTYRVRKTRVPWTRQVDRAEGAPNLMRGCRTARITCVRQPAAVIL
jgi:hypothetical protein